VLQCTQVHLYVHTFNKTNLWQVLLQISSLEYGRPSSSPPLPQVFNLSHLNG